MEFVMSIVYTWLHPYRLISAYYKYFLCVIYVSIDSCNISISIPTFIFPHCKTKIKLVALSYL